MSAPSLARAIASAAVDRTVLMERHGPLIELARRLLGVEAFCYPFLEIWPTSLRTYNLLVPNFVDVPFSLLGFGPSMGLRGTGMYAASLVAQCMYCSAHSCVVAQRGQANRGTLARIQDDDAGETPGERALLAVARGMASVPSSVRAEDVRALDEAYGRSDADWLAHAIAMMGFLNKMMDTMGFDLEQAIIDENGDLAPSSGWTPGRHDVVEDGRPRVADAGSPKRMVWSMLRFMPAAISTDKRWTKGIPTKADRATALLQEISGYDFPMLSGIRQGRVVRALTTMLRDNLVADDSVLGMQSKHLAGLHYVSGLQNPAFLDGARVLARHAGLCDTAIEAAVDGRVEDTEGSPALEASFALASAAAPSPAKITTELVDTVTTGLEPAQLIELMTWFSLLSLLNRVDAFQQARAAA